MRNKLRARNQAHMITEALGFGLLSIDRADPKPVPARALRFKPTLIANE